MKILVLNYEYPPIGGGAGKVTQNLCNVIETEYPVKQIIVTSWTPGLRFKERAGNNSIIYRIFTFRFNTYKTSFFAMATYIICSMLPVIFLCIKYKPKMIHSHFLFPVSPIAFIIKRIIGIPYVITLHGGDAPGFDKRTKIIYKLLGSIPSVLLKSASAVTGVSRQVCDVIENLYHVPAIYIPNGISNDWFSSVSHVLEKPLNIIRIIFIGRLVSLKNVDLMLRALAFLKDSIKWEFDIYGDGDEKKRLMSLARDLAITKRTHFHGWVDEDVIKKALKRSHIFLLVSDAEGFSVAALQAMASGCGLVVSRIPANEPLIVEGENGYFCDFNVESLSGNIERSIKRATEFGLKSIEMARGYQWKFIAGQYMKVFTPILQRKGPDFV